MLELAPWRRDPESHPWPATGPSASTTDAPPTWAWHPPSGWGGAPNPLDLGVLGLPTPAPVTAELLPGLLSLSPLLPGAGGAGRPKD